MDSRKLQRVVVCIEEPAAQEKCNLYTQLLREFESKLALFVRKHCKSEGQDVCGLYSLTGDQHEKFTILREEYISPIEELNLGYHESFAAFLDRRSALVLSQLEKFDGNQKVLKALVSL
jgi:hypothetical protein